MSGIFPQKRNIGTEQQKILGLLISQSKLLQKMEKTRTNDAKRSAMRNTTNWIRMGEDCD
ncbi:MAG: hypothetical protein IJT36_02740 [Alphaproteobacteria bacterium]|nr:hypothetical protein [Alphaproteobacteria bacterium]